jgi:serine/threonine protein kinase
MAGEQIELGIPGLTDATPIGQGGFAVVYRARQAHLARDVAVKVLNATLDATAQARFERECQALGALSSHPGIVTVYESGLAQSGRPYLVMEYLPAGSLEDRLQATGPIPWHEAVQMGGHLARALDAAHRAGVVHRDIKPANVLIGGYGQVLLGDFGIASVAGTPQTASGVVTATIAHAAPEVLGRSRPTERSDLYSLGSTLFELIEGKPAFLHDGDQSIVSLIARIAQEPVPSLAGRGVPPALQAVIERSMKKGDN